ncbi:MAG: enoyl-CoA hydratase/isomerase family protein [Sporichthyaceae bacterium]
MSEDLAAAPRLDKDGTVAVLSLGAGENRFNLDSIAAADALIDEVEAGGYTSLVTSAEGKIWSNGFDTPWLSAHPDRAAATIQAGEMLCARVLGLGIPTVAALQGHTFAGGLIYALAHDVRVMREDRGFLCLPEVTFGAVFTPGMIDLLHARLSPQVAHRAMVLGHRFAAPEALSLGVVDEICAEGDVLGRAVALAGSMAGHDRVRVGELKRAVYARPLATLGGPTPQNLLDALLALG